MEHPYVRAVRIRSPIEELIPESQANGRIDLVTLSFIIGFTIMMVLDVALG